MNTDTAIGKYPIGQTPFLKKLPWNKSSWPSVKHCQTIVSQAKNMAVHYHVFY